MGYLDVELVPLNKLIKELKVIILNMKKNEDYFNIIDNDTKAYLLGVIAGDGHIQSNLISIVANKTDRETIDLFISELFPKEKPELRKYGNCFSVGISSTFLCNDILRHLKILPGKKSDKIILPEFNDKKLTWAFIRGIFDTDGCVASIYAKQKSPSCFCSSTSIQILDQIKQICDNEDIKSNIYGIKLKFQGLNSLKFLKKIYENDGYALTRKKEMFKLWLSWVPFQGNCFHKREISSTRKLSSDMLKNLFIDMKQLKLPKYKIAMKYGISPTTLNDILDGKTYKNES